VNRLRPSATISIVIPVFNGADYLEEAVSSALSQTHENKEVIVVNDGSSDGGATEAIALAFGNRVRYFSKPNGGVASALNFGIRQMSGDFFSWLSHDDLYVPTKIEAQLDFLSQFADLSVAYSDYEVFADGRTVAAVRFPPTDTAHFRYLLTINNSLHGCTLLIPRHCFEQCGTFNERLLITQDYDLWFRIAARFPFRHFPEIVVRARSHSQQGSRRFVATMYSEIDVLLSRFVDELRPQELAGEDRTICAGYAEIAESMARRGFFYPCRHALRLAIKHARCASLGDTATILLALARAGFAAVVTLPFRRFKSWLKLHLIPG